MGFYNMTQGDAPIFHALALNYAISDNYHQAVQGGTGASHIALGTGFVASYQDASGAATPPPAGEIENPNPKPATSNNRQPDDPVRLPPPEFPDPRAIGSLLAGRRRAA